MGREDPLLFSFSESVKTGEQQEQEVGISQLEEILAVCPLDLVSRGKLAMALERVGRQDGALENWNMIVEHSPNDLQAREGVARCRRAMSSAVQSAPGT
ncbi:MAG: tetratricopeptide repeat protein [Nitrospira sp.]